MDILAPLLLMAIFYFGPALLKSYRAKKNPQSAITEQQNYEMMNVPQKIKNMTSVIEPQSTKIVDKVESAPPGMKEQSPWQGNLDQNMIINGVIFAEILKAPRGYRPFGKS